VPEELTKESFFHGARGGDGCRQSQLLRPIRPLENDGGNIQHARQFADGIKDRGTRTTEFGVPTAIVLAAMDENRAPFGEASPDAVCPFNLLRPDAAEPDAPIFELFSPCFIAAMVNCNSLFVAQKNDIPLLPDDRIETIDLFPGVQNEISERFA
jgi:hypothetical protein